MCHIALFEMSAAVEHALAVENTGFFWRNHYAFPGGVISYDIECMADDGNNELDPNELVCYLAVICMCAISVGEPQVDLS